MKKQSLLVVAITCLALVSACSQQQKKPKTALKTIHFDYDKSEIRTGDAAILQDNATWMQNNSQKDVTIEGHCDERGSFEYNIALGDRRARAAETYLQNLGVSSSRLNTVSYGEEKPVATCHDESCWWQNRRDDFVAK